MLLVEKRALKHLETMNVVARCITASLGLSHKIRRDVLCGVAFGKHSVVWFRGDVIKQWRPDANSTLGLLRKILNGRRHPGVWIGGLEEAEKLLPDAKKLLFRFVHNAREMPNIKPPYIAYVGMSDVASEVRYSLTIDFPEKLYPDQAIAIANIISDRG